MAGMDDAWVRVKRAQAKLDRLKIEIAAFQKAHPNSVVVNHDGKGRVRLVARIGGRPPEEWGLLSGDILVDLRSALDYAVYALAVAHTGQGRPADAHRLEFPICESDTRWDEAIGRRKLAGLRPEAVAYIEAEQPYQPANRGTDIETPALLVFEDLVGVNKHRFIHVFQTNLHRFSVPMMGTGLRVEDAITYRVSGELKDGAVLASFRLVATQKNAQINMQPNLTTQICFEPTVEGSPPGDVLYVLGVICEVVRQYVGKMETYL